MSVRSIPACTGEPSGGRTATRAIWVYPRVYGGTDKAGDSPRYKSGLSPRVRGNRGWKCEKAKSLRSIPACTGEPALARLLRAAASVYPRVYGGTCKEDAPCIKYIGLSPRVRGNH